MSISRADARNAVYAGLLAHMVDPTKPLTDGYVRAVTNGLPFDLSAEAVIMVSSAGSHRPSESGQAFRGDSADYRIQVALYVRGAVEGSEAWTAEIAENILDACEERIAQWAKQNMGEAEYWKRLSYDEPTEPATELVGSIPYRREYIYFTAKVF